jgi:hypothetical protein
VYVGCLLKYILVTVAHFIAKGINSSEFAVNFFSSSSLELGRGVNPVNLAVSGFPQVTKIRPKYVNECGGPFYAGELARDWVL